MRLILDMTVVTEFWRVWLCVNEDFFEVLHICFYFPFNLLLSERNLLPL